MIKLHKQCGFSLVTAIFLLVILSSIGAFMVTIGGTQRTTTVAAIQGARAFQAARSGIEWAIKRVIDDNNCNAVTMNPTFTLNVPGLNGFTVTLSCDTTMHDEVGTNDVIVYTINSNASYGTYGSADFVRRRITATISP